MECLRLQQIKDLELDQATDLGSDGMKLRL